MTFAHGVDDQVEQVAADQWRSRVQQARDAGFTWFDRLGCVDEAGRADELRIVVRLAERASGRGLQLHTRIPRDEPRLDSIREVFAGADWHEREAHDFFGVVFDGGDMAPLLNHTPGVHPLRKDFVLAARAVRNWPGAKEPGEGPGAASRRRMAPPGVPDPTVWGDRDPSQPAATADEIAQAVSGGRVRRRR